MTFLLNAFTFFLLNDEEYPKVEEIELTEETRILCCVARIGSWCASSFWCLCLIENFAVSVSYCFHSVFTFVGHVLRINRKKFLSCLIEKAIVVHFVLCLLHKRREKKKRSVRIFLRLFFFNS